MSDNPDSDEDEEYGVQKDYNETIGKIEKTPFSLGVELSNGEMDIMIPRNTEIPHIQTLKYKTIKDNQPKIILKVYQGERLLAEKNEKLGECILENIPPKPKGQVIIEATLEVREDHFFNIILKENVNGTQSALINKINMHEDKDKDYFENIYNEAKKYEKEDKRIIDINCKKNDIIYYCNRLINNGNEEEKNKANEILNWIKTDINDDIKEYEQKLNEIKKFIKK